MKGYIDKLLSISSQPLGDSSPFLSQAILSLAGTLGSELHDLLSKKNGFYAFESALHVFPAGHFQDVMDLEKWNSNELWRESYGTLAETNKDASGRKLQKLIGKIQRTIS
jgi:hypothetical protein